MTADAWNDQPESESHGRSGEPVVIVDVSFMEGLPLSPPKLELHDVLEFVHKATSLFGTRMPSLLAVYLDSDINYDQLRGAFEKIVEAFVGPAVASHATHPGPADIRPRRFWKALTGVFKRQTKPERLDQAGDAFTAGAKARWYGEPQSQITKAQDEAITGVLGTLQGTENALLAFSNILIVKIDGVPLVRELTPEQVEHLQKNPRLYTDPRLALSVLDGGLASIHEPGPDDGQPMIAS